ncbi:hypothetical protein JW887_03040 [Candidatus Dojkabacteria bacterium]|nr:hypothetical protein [Candidatus Dojkabacteria bacterium]
MGKRMLQKIGLGGVFFLLCIIGLILADTFGILPRKTDITATPPVLRSTSYSWQRVETQQYLLEPGKTMEFQSQGEVFSMTNSTNAGLICARCESIADGRIKVNGKIVGSYSQSEEDFIISIIK